MIYKRLSNFLDVKNLKYSSQFGFWQKYSTIHALSNFFEIIRQILNEVSFSCGIFAALKEAFDTADHKILLHKFWCI